MNDRVDILLATFQGDLYLKEQLQSIMQQSYPHFNIMIRDDVSTDQTLPIIEHFCLSYPERITLLPSLQRLGVKGNFSAMMPHAKASYIMFCDQDDVWLPNKIEASLQKMKEMESQYGAHIPLLVHTDLQVVDSDLTLISPSFWNYSHLDPTLASLNRLLVQNIVTGCTMMINQSLLQLAYPIPNQSIMHDWWLALVATLFGKIDYLNEQSLLYRQHGKNDVGAKKFKRWQLIKNRILRGSQDTNLKKYEQAREILERYDHLLNSTQKETLQIFYSLKDLSYFKRMKCQLTHQFMPRL